MEFWKIYDQFYGPVRKFILAYVRDEWVADDLIQETFIRVQKNLDSVKDPSKISSWIFRIAHNLCHDHFRQSKRSSLNQRNIQREILGFKEAVVQKELERQQMGECVQDKMDLLPPDYRTVLILSDIMTFSQKEIAEILGITVSNVKVRVHRARNKFRAILEEHCSFEVDERSVLVCDPKEEE
ncbi:MAG: sigma-70 family RNA polymerase sigma factor [Deltaproteobacteria bacterium]|nr:MAG: sigma-70 family RNA polymerase sigma factor [Deltaproteobacteria bacterium]